MKIRFCCPYALVAMAALGATWACNPSEKSSVVSVGAPNPAGGTTAQAAQTEAHPHANNAPASTVPPPVAPTCPEGLLPIPGGSFAIGSASPTYEDEENPRFWTQVASFCAERTEVTAALYGACLAAGRCSEPERKSKRCTAHATGKEHHPINCITYGQAEAVCEFRGLRLPTEVEWEYLARGGAEMRKYPWGDAEPDGRTCWKHPETCVVGSFTAGAFGLVDVTGNVWEWTSSWFGAYPWPSEQGRHRVYRGGSFSRRFEKWLKPTLRNRSNPNESGSHLGVRCVADAAGAQCPYGKTRSTSAAEGTKRSTCLFGVERVECPKDLEWNGVRCARSGEPRCASGSREVEGHGCVRDVGAANASGTNAQANSTGSELDLSLVSRTRSPQFDADCAENQPSRPLSFRYSGGEHLARNRVMAQVGCKNRDVGVGWNSGCCPR